MNSRLRTFAAIALLVTTYDLISSDLHAQDTAAAPAPEASESEPVWPFETSDIQVDPGFTFGVLDNGMRFILRENKTPEGTALVRMRIDSGSLEETEEERGLAHYLEHMAFNGSKGIPEGEMIKLLEREGLAFGADTNASTGFGAITYMLNLPRNDEDLLDTALMLMRETASELTIAEDAVERERGVILAEERDRRTFQNRAREDNWEFIVPDARYPERLPIGLIPVIENATAAQLRALYERTYTPANTVLVIAGDFPVDVMEAKLRERFTDWSGPPAPEEPVTGPVDIDRQGLTDIYLDPALSETVTISRFSDWQDEPDTLANRQKAGLRGIAFAIINRRLGRLASGEDAPFRGASYGGGDIFEDARITSLSVSSVDGEWKKGMLAAVREVNQALTFGFTQAEIDEQLANIRTAVENSVQSADTRTNGSYVGAALSLVSDEQIPTEPSYRLSLVDALAKKATPESVQEALRDYAAPFENPLIRFQGRTAPEGGEAALRTAFSEGKALAIAAPEDTGPAEFAYQDFGPAGTIIEDSVEERLGIRRIRFANGVRLNLKQTDIREDRISVRVELDGGDLMATKDDPLKVYMAGSLTAGGLGKHSADDLQTVLAGKSVGYRFGVDTETFTMAASTTPRDLDLQMKVLTAFITDPGYRPEGVERFRKGLANFFETLDATPGRALSTNIGAILSDNDPRFSLQPQEAYEALDFEKLKAAITDRLQNGAIEVALVGDLDEEAAIAAVAASFGALPTREFAFQPREEARIRTFTADRSVREIDHSGEPDKALIRFVWPTRDDSDLVEDTQLSLLAGVARIMVLEKLREELGQAYSPSVGSSTSYAYPGYGTFNMSVSVGLEQIVPSAGAMKSIVEELRAKPVDEDIIDRARKPSLESFDNMLKSLGGWMGLVDNAQSRPDRLERYFAFPDTMKAISGEDLQAAATKYLDPEMGVMFIVSPGPVKSCASPGGCGTPAPAPTAE